MDIMLSHFTALEAIRRQETRWILEKDRPARPRIMGNVPADAPSDGEVTALLARSPLLAGLSQPLETLVPHGAGRRRSRLVKTHVCAQPIPASSFLELAPGVRCVSPEHLAVQLAPLLSELELIVLLSELLGIYAEPGFSYYFDNGSFVETVYRERPFNFSLSLGLRFNLN